MGVAERGMKNIARIPKMSYATPYCQVFVISMIFFGQVMFLVTRIRSYSAEPCQCGVKWGRFRRVRRVVGGHETKASFRKNHFNFIPIPARKMALDCCIQQHI